MKAKYPECTRHLIISKFTNKLILRKKHFAEPFRFEYWSWDSSEYSLFMPSLCIHCGSDGRGLCCGTVLVINAPGSMIGCNVASYHYGLAITWTGNNNGVILRYSTARMITKMHRDLSAVPVCFCGGLIHHGLTLIPPWINNYIQYKMWDKITDPFPLGNGYVISPTLYNGSNYISMLIEINSNNDVVR